MVVNDKIKKRPAKKQGGFFGMLAATLLIAVAFGAIIYGMYYLNIMNIFEVFDKNTNQTDNLPESPDIDNLLEQYEKPEYRLIYSVTPEELLTVIASLSVPDAYTLSAETVDFGGESRVTKLTAEKKGEKFNIARTSYDADGAERLSESIVCDGETITVKNNNDLKSMVYSVNDRFDFESYCRIPSLAELTALCSRLTEAENDDGTKCEVSLVTSESGSFYKVVVEYDLPEQKDEYYLSLDTGILMSAFTYVGDKLVYRFIISDFAITDALLIE